MPFSAFVNFGLEKRKKSENHISEGQHQGYSHVAEDTEPKEPLGANRAQHF